MEKVKSILVSADVSLTSVVSTVVHHRKRTVRSPASVHPLALSQAWSVTAAWWTHQDPFSFSLGALIERRNRTSRPVRIFHFSFNELCRANRNFSKRKKKKGSSLQTWLTHSRGMLNKRPCLIQICNAFSTAAAPADHCQLAQEWGLVGLCPLPVDEVFHSVFSVYSLSLFFLFLFSFSTRCPPTYTLTVNGSTDVVGKMMGGDKDEDRERERESEWGGGISQQFDFPHGLRKMIPAEEWSVSKFMTEQRQKKGRKRVHASCLFF